MRPHDARRLRHAMSLPALLQFTATTARVSSTRVIASRSVPKRSASWRGSKQNRTHTPVTLLREHSQRKLPSVGFPKAQDLFAHRARHIFECRLDSTAVGRQQYGRRERRKGQIGGGESLADQKAAPIAQQFVHLSKYAEHAFE